MYQIKDTDTFYRTDPWNKPYDVRVSWIFSGSATGRMGSFDCDASFVYVLLYFCYEYGIFYGRYF